MLDLQRIYVGICGQAASKLVQKSVTRQQSVYVRVGQISNTLSREEILLFVLNIIDGNLDITFLGLDFEDVMVL